MMSMARRTPVRTRPGVDAAPHIDVVQPDTPALTTGRFKALLESTAQEILAVTYWFNPGQHAGPYPVTIRFSGRRVGKKGRPSPGDQFIHDETIEEVIPGSGPVSLTARIRGINPGEWIVTAHMLESAHSAHVRKEQGTVTPAAGPLYLATRFWYRWAPSVELAEQARTCPTPFARVPGIIPGIWGTMMTLGIVVALALQALVISSKHLVVGSVWIVSLVAIVLGIIGAKVWFIVIHRHEHRIEGWCIQGFITGATLAGAIMLTVLHVPVGVFLDATAPGLLVAMAVGRVGCFFAGCCGGPLTASRWGVWSSDQRVGARRIPTQLLESVLALSLGLGMLVLVLSHGPDDGAFFIAALASYTLVRQGILRLRAEPRKTRLGGLVIGTLATLVLIADIVFLAR